MELLPVAPMSLPSAHATDDRLMIRDLARHFAMHEVLPLANELDPVQGEMPDDLIAQMAKMGFFGITIDADHGGLGLGLFEYVVVTEELARAWMSVASIIARGNGHGGQFPASLRDELLPRMARGEYLGATAISEPDAGSDVASIRTRAERVGDEWVLNGQKMWCTFGDRADYLIVYARTTPYDPERRHVGIRSFYIPKERGSFPPGMTGNPIRKMFRDDSQIGPNPQGPRAGCGTVTSMTCDFAGVGGGLEPPPSNRGLGGWCRTGSARRGDRLVEGHVCSGVVVGGGVVVAGAGRGGAARLAVGL
jgi:alkylation response protein AidB-like acyl-CoA dehydrogenase